MDSPNYKAAKNGGNQEIKEASNKDGWIKNVKRGGVVKKTIMEKKEK